MKTAEQYLIDSIPSGYKKDTDEETFLNFNKTASHELQKTVYKNAIVTAVRDVDLDQDDENEVTHTVFFGENIKRILKVFRKEKVSRGENIFPNDLYDFKYLDSWSKSPLDLQTLYRIKGMFILHSDTSPTCNGFWSLCQLIKDTENEYDMLPKISNEIKVEGQSVVITDTSK